MTTQVILQPASNEDARRHYQDTIEAPVPLDVLTDFLSSSDIDVLRAAFPEGSVPTWGATPGKRGQTHGKWERIQRGAIALFSWHNAIRTTGLVVHKVRNQQLARQLWGVHDDGSTWEYIYFVDQLKDCEIPYSVFNRAAGYDPGYVIQGFQVLAEDVSARILSSIDLGTEEAIAGTYEDFLQGTTLDPDAPLDAVGRTLIRKEQGFVRRQLFGRESIGTCSMCGRSLPVDLLVAAHIKKRSLCSLDEKRDYRNNVLAMCKLGCDELYEKGYILVSNGTIQANPLRATELLEPSLANLVGRKCQGPGTASQAYFEFHTRHHTQGFRSNLIQHPA